MKPFPPILLATLCLAAALHAEEPGPVPAPPASRAESAESKPHAESAEAAEPGSPAGGAAERSEAEGVAGAPAGGAAERSEAEGVPHAEPAAPGGDAIQHSAFSTQHSPLSATVSLTDGSSLKGSLRHRFLPAESATLGRLRIDLSSVESIAFKPDPAVAARVTFRNGDLVSAVLAPKHDHLVLDTLVGPLAIPLRAVASLAIASDATDALIYHCTFDSPSSITRPVVGPAGTFLGGDFVPGKVGNALRTPGDIPVAEIDLPRGFMQSRGTIEFWAKIEDPPAFYGDGGNPGFFGMWLFDNPSDPGLCSTYLCFNANNGMGMAGLCGMVYHRAMATDPHMRTNTYAPILSAPSDWHHYAIAWDAEGLSFATASDGTPAVATLVLDGRVLQTFGRNQLSRGKGLLDLPKKIGKLAFPVPAARWNASAKRVPFLIDEFKIWSEPRIAP